MFRFIACTSTFVSTWAIGVIHYPHRVQGEKEEAHLPVSVSVIDEQKQAIETLVDRILAAKHSDPAAVQPLETQIDHSRRWQGSRVARLQGIRMQCLTGLRAYA